ncbi:IclR family transcriptional regulator domain-containing protein [Streptomyces sp. 4N509B]|uniref:IclR family transcriptional regulator domain-containing protein n=1 Tax=Streptomyces sp. 4N509B TaxID=3457413 RepID=UPI003FD25E8F
MAITAHSPARTARLALRVLEAVAGCPDGMPAADLAAAAGVTPRQLARLLPILCQDEYLERLPDDAYVPGPALLLLGSGGSRAREEFRDRRLRTALAALRDALDTPVYLGRYVDGELVVAHVAATPERPGVNEWVDFRAAAHATALGKCLLSQLDHEGRQDHLSRHRAARLTSRTITDQRVLLSALDRQPATVPVLDLQEYAVGTLCAAVPLTAGSHVACLALSLPVAEAHRLREAAESLNDRAAPALLSLAF